MFHWIIFLVLIVCQNLFLIVLIALLAVVFSNTWTSHARVLKNTACIKFICFFRSKMQTKMILRPLSPNVHSPNSSHCKFGAWQNSEVAGRTDDFGNWIKIWFFESYCPNPIITLRTAYCLGRICFPRLIYYGQRWLLFIGCTYKTIYSI